MSERSAARLWLARTGVAGCILMAAIIVSSAYLRLTTMGIGCEPWPACYGRIQAPTASVQTPTAETQPASVKLARLAHRAAAMLVAILAVLTLLLSLTRTVRSVRNVALSVTILALTVMLAAIGRLSATLLVPAVGVANLLGGFALLACFRSLQLNNGDDRDREETIPIRLRWMTGLLLLVFVLQAAAGALISVTYSAALCRSLWSCDAPPDPARDLQLFEPQPLDAHRKVVAAPAAASLQKGHRVSGVASAALFALFGLWLLRVPACRRSGAALLSFASIEGAIGILMATHDFPLAAAMTHNAVAACLLVVLVGLVWPRASPRSHAGSD